uniref:Vitronectin n=1 Tax=Loxodonta africana TaxID=9785 RepID=G3TMX5_LOXAF
MAPPRPLLMLALLAWAALADQESCKGRCTEGFNADKKCQCDELCSYYQSCCTDYIAECKPQVTRGDVFTLPEDEYGTYDYRAEIKDNTSSHTQPESSAQGPDLLRSVEQSPVEILEKEDSEPEKLIPGPEAETPGSGISDPGISESLEEEELCSGKPFDAFTDLKNGSLFAFRGQYCYELDEKAVRPGYPKLIRDVWGIEGPIDAAFTRINCQGKTYLFKGSQYWRYEDGVLDAGYPRNISGGFKGIPDNVDAALALPAHSYSGRERYFFKGYSGEWVGRMIRSVVQSPISLPHFRWGRPPVIPKPQARGLPALLKGALLRPIAFVLRVYSSSRDLPVRREWERRPPGPLSLPPFSSEESGLGYYDYDMDWLVPASCEPIQSVYFFSGDKYYRVNLRTKRVDTVSPPYPRPIAQYWLGCPAPGS